MLLHLARRLVGEARCRVFDWRHNVETCGDVVPDAESVAADTLQHGVFYSPSHVTLLHRLFDGLDIDYERFTFVDIGSGKGRALLMASEFPFRRVIGVEYDAKLHAIASHNVHRYRSRTQRCHDIECLHRDALQFPFPPGPLVVYMYNPFRPPVLVPLLRNLQASYARSPREILLLYASPYHREHVTEETVLRPAQEARYYTAFRTPEDSPAIELETRTVA